jgi:hypothetical protein
MDDSYKEEFERFKAGGSNMLAQSERSRKRVDVHALHLAPRLASYRNEEGVSTSHPHAPMAYALYASDGFLEITFGSHTTQVYHQYGAQVGMMRKPGPFGQDQLKQAGELLRWALVNCDQYRDDPGAVLELRRETQMGQPAEVAVTQAGVHYADTTIVTITSASDGYKPVPAFDWMVHKPWDGSWRRCYHCAEYTDKACGLCGIRLCAKLLPLAPYKWACCACKITDEDWDEARAKLERKRQDSLARKDKGPYLLGLMAPSIARYPGRRSKDKDKVGSSSSSEKPSGDG